MKDLFSAQSVNYSKFRPTYSRDLFTYLATLSHDHKLVWDCGTGSGQAASGLAEYFQKVYATDISEKQLSQAVKHERVEYVVAPAEKTLLPNKSVDMITVAQAFHWFRHEDFFKEVKRVSKPHAILALWSYNLFYISEEIDREVMRLYEDILGPYWEPERRLVEQEYKNVHVPFLEIQTPSFMMRATWTLEHLFGFLESWSSLQTYIQKEGANPLDSKSVRSSISTAWGAQSTYEVKWKVSMRAFQIF